MTEQDSGDAVPAAPEGLGAAKELLGAGNWEAAGAAAQAAIAEGAEDADWYLILATAEVGSGLFDAALEHGATAERRGAGAPALLVEARALLGLGRFGEALAFADATVELGGDTEGNALRARGIALDCMGDHSGAGIAFRQSLRLAPDNREVRRLLRNSWIAGHRLLIAMGVVAIGMAAFALLSAHRTLIALPLTVMVVLYFGWGAVVNWGDRKLLSAASAAIAMLVAAAYLAAAIT